MTSEDLDAVGRWLQAPHVARWFLPETTADVEVEKYRQRIDNPASPTKMCTVELAGRPIGWCQWYRWADYPEDGACVGAQTGDFGTDYAIGDADAIDRGVGTAMISTIVTTVRLEHPGAGFVVAPEAVNLASRRVLEKNGFELRGVRPLSCEPHERPMAIYRLGGETEPASAGPDAEQGRDQRREQRRVDQPIR